MNFLFTCKDESHPWIAEQFEQSFPETFEAREWNGRFHIERRYKWINGVENRAYGENLKVNYLYFEIYSEEKDAVTYKGSYATLGLQLGWNILWNK